MPKAAPGCVWMWMEASIFGVFAISESASKGRPARLRWLRAPLSRRSFNSAGKPRGTRILAPHASAPRSCFSDIAHSMADDPLASVDSLRQSKPELSVLLLTGEAYGVPEKKGTS